MRYIILTRRSLLIIMLCTLLLVASAAVGITTATEAVTTATTDRVIPIYCVDTDKKICSISFDAAWGNEQTDGLLDTLDKYKVKTTFFLVGSWAEKYPESVKEIAKRGHDVGNHSATHAHMTQISSEDMLTELENCNNKIEKLTGKRPTLFRPPYGDYDNNVVNTVMSLDMYCVQWNIDSLDWKDPSVDQIVQNCTSKLQPGSIILLHNGATNTPEALPKVIEAIHAQGYKIVPISKILPKGKYTTDVQGKMIINN
ncbi:MAG: polysaccharide deacetylase family protein [Ruminococcus sp.]|nr:polysaccharide deacetylase family protein [Ruminococcus sp.]